MPYHHDKYWRSDADVYELYRTRARLHDGVIKMRGTFRAALLNEFTYDNIFVPTDDGEPTFVIPVFEGCCVIDIVAIGNNVWGCVVGAAAYIGTITGRVYDSPAEWLAGEIGILVLAKDCFAAELAAQERVSF